MVDHTLRIPGLKTVKDAMVDHTLRTPGLKTVKDAMVDKARVWALLFRQWRAITAP